MRVVVVGGGSGGHVIPALAVSTALQRRGAQILFVGSRKPEEATLVRDHGFEFRPITAGKLRRYFSLATVIEPFKVAAGLWQSLLILRGFRPAVVFAKGGYVSLPMVWAARLRGIPVVLHESDTVPGLANRLGAAQAAQIAVAFPPNTMTGLPITKLTYTGNPIRREVLTGKSERAFQKYKLYRKLPLVLVLGGSQGSRRLNQLISDALPELLPELQVVHQVGTAAVSEVAAMQADLSPEQRDRYRTQGFFGDELFDLYAAADLVVSRSGANGLAEIAAAGKPSILVPHDIGSSGHQAANAVVFRESGAAVVLAEADLTASELARHIKLLIHDSQRRAEMGRLARSLSMPDATEKVAELVWATGAHRA